MALGTSRKAGYPRQDDDNTRGPRPCGGIRSGLGSRWRSVVVKDGDDRRRERLRHLGAALRPGSCERRHRRAVRGPAPGLDFTNAAADNWSYSARQAWRKTDPGMILCFGTSLAKYGVVAPLIERATGHRTFNLAVCRGQMPSTCWLFAKERSMAVRSDRGLSSIARTARPNAPRPPAAVPMRSTPTSASGPSCLPGAIASTSPGPPATRGSSSRWPSPA